MCGDFRVNALKNLFVQACHVVGPERRPKRYSFIKNAPQRPDITLLIVRLVSPHFWTGIVWRTSLSIKKSFLGNFRNIHVTEFCRPILVQKDICAFQVTVENGGLMKSTQAPNNLNENAPNVLFLDVSLVFLVASNFLEKVPVIRIIHHDA